MFSRRWRPSGSIPSRVPLMAAPVKATLFKHQQRAVNMCLLAFGVITPEQMGGGTP